MSAEMPPTPQLNQEMQLQEVQPAYWLREHSGAEQLYPVTPIQAGYTEQIQHAVPDTGESVAVARDAVASAYGPESPATAGITGSSTEGTSGLSPAWPLGNGEKVSRKQTKEAVSRYDNIAISPDGKSATELGADGVTRSINTIYAKRIREMANAHHIKSLETTPELSNAKPPLRLRISNKMRNSLAASAELVIAPSEVVYATNNELPEAEGDSTGAQSPDVVRNSEQEIMPARVIGRGVDEHGREIFPTVGFDNDFARRLLAEMKRIDEFNKPGGKKRPPGDHSRLSQGVANTSAMRDLLSQLEVAGERNEYGEFEIDKNGNRVIGDGPNGTHLDSKDRLVDADGRLIGEDGKYILIRAFRCRSGGDVDQDLAEEIYTKGRKLSARESGYTIFDRDSDGRIIRSNPVPQPEVTGYAPGYGEPPVLSTKERIVSSAKQSSVDNIEELKRRTDKIRKSMSREGDSDKTEDD